MAFGMPSATLLPSGVVTKAPSSLGAVRRVKICPKATLYGAVSVYLLEMAYWNRVFLRVRSDTELRTPLLGNDFCEPGHACFGHAIVDLATTIYQSYQIGSDNSGHLRISVDTTCTADIDDIPWLPILDSKVWRCGSDKPEWRCVVECNYRVPLLVSHLRLVYISLVDLLKETTFLIPTLCITPSQVKPA